MIAVFQDIWRLRGRLVQGEEDQLWLTTFKQGKILASEIY